jgi:hypothetical protein
MDFLVYWSQEIGEALPGKLVTGEEVAVRESVECGPPRVISGPEFMVEDNTSDIL